jgi:hypothetical protein
MFEKAALTVAAVTTAGLIKPTIDMFGARIRDYVASKAGGLAVKVVTKTAEELAREALGG